MATSSISSQNTETLCVFYTSKDDVGVTSHPNCMMFKAKRSQEVILLDVMVAMPDALGTQYNFWASDNNGTGPLIPLQSPTSVIPVTENGQIFLHLEPSSASLVVPMKQSLAYADISRQQIYDPRHYQTASEQASATTQSPLHHSSEKTKRFCEKHGQAAAPTSSPFPAFDDVLESQSTFDPFNLGDQQLPPPRQSAGGQQQEQRQLPRPATAAAAATAAPVGDVHLWDDIDADDSWLTSSDKPAEPSNSNSGNSGSSSGRTPAVSGSASTTDSGRRRTDAQDTGASSSSAKYRDHPFSASQERSPPRSTGPKHTRDSYNNHQNNKGGSSGTADDSDLSVAALAEATTQAARSIFSFATKSLKTVATASTAAVSRAAEGKGISEVAAAWGQAVGNAGPLVVVKVGSTRVRIVRELAQGGFGVVLLAQDAALPEDSRQGQGQYALKQMLCQSREQVEEAQNEVRSLQRFAGHAHIVSLVDHSSAATKGGAPSHRTVLLLFPLYAHGTAWDKIEQCTGTGTGAGEREGSWPFSERRALKVCMGVARALEFMHDNGRGFTHRDVKPHNVLLGGGPSGDDPDHAVLTDLGSVAAARVEIATRQQALAAEDEAACKTSAAYRAPELTSVPQPPCVLDETVDVWGLGCTLYCLAFGHSPFESTREGVLRLAILNGRFSYPPHYRHPDCQYSEAFVGLVNDMLQLAPGDRPSAADVAERCQRMLQG